MVKHVCSSPGLLTKTTHSYKVALLARLMFSGFPLANKSNYLPNQQHMVRSYTHISSGRADTGLFDMLVKSYPAGNISKASLVAEQSNEGPEGQFIYRPGPVRAFGVISGGTGITFML
jgi:cytochrome-b5 reductase